MVAHPAALLALLAGAAVVIAGKIFYDEYYNEYKSYEQFHSNHSHYEREFNRFHRNYNDFDFDDEGEEEQKVVNREGFNEESDIRKRKPFKASNDINENMTRSTSNDYDQDQYELNELEASIAERKRRLMAEQAFLDHEEENLRNRKNALMNNNFDDVTTEHASKFSGSSSEDDYDEHSLKNHMAVFDPFADHFQDTQDNSVHSLSNSDSTERMIVVDNNDRQSDQQETSLGSSSELRYPSPHSNSPPTSSVTSVSGEDHAVASISDSEESWDAISEQEDWNQSSRYSSDGEHHSHRSIASDSDDDRLRF